MNNLFNFSLGCGIGYGYLHRIPIRSQLGGPQNGNSKQQPPLQQSHIVLPPPAPLKKPVTSPSIQHEYINPPSHNLPSSDPLRSFKSSSTAKSSEIIQPPDINSSFQIPSTASFSLPTSNTSLNISNSQSQNPTQYNPSQSIQGNIGINQVPVFPVSSIIPHSLSEPTHNSSIISPPNIPNVSIFNMFIFKQINYLLF